MSRRTQSYGRAWPLLVALVAVLVGIDRWPNRTGRHGGPLTGAVTHVRDGDTIVVAGTPVRIANLDCAEMDTRAGRRAKVRMEQLVEGQPLAGELEGRRSYDREVGTCALAATGRDLGEVLIGEGTCGRWR